MNQSSHPHSSQGPKMHNLSTDKKNDGSVSSRPPKGNATIQFGTGSRNAVPKEPSAPKPLLTPKSRLNATISSGTEPLKHGMSTGAPSTGVHSKSPNGVNATTGSEYLSSSVDNNIWANSSRGATAPSGSSQSNAQNSGGAQNPNVSHTKTASNAYGSVGMRPLSSLDGKTSH
jgi:hypothetical protein